MDDSDQGGDLIHSFILTLICRILALWAWENCFAALWLSFHTCKMG